MPLLESGHRVVGAVEMRDQTQNWSRLQRWLKILYWRCLRGRQPPHLRHLAEAHDIPYITIETVGDQAFVAWLKALKPDVLVVYKMSILSEEILSVPVYGAINIHPSLLPRYRGSSPILWMHHRLDLEGGVTVNFVDRGMDTGDIIYQQPFPIEIGMSEVTVEQLAVDQFGIPLLVKALDAIADNNCPRVRQPATSPTPSARRVTGEKYWQMIDWNQWSLEHTWHFLRCTPWWRFKLPPHPIVGETIEYWIGAYERSAHSAVPGSLQRDTHGFYFAHPRGKIRVLQRFSFKRFMVHLLRVFF